MTLFLSANIQRRPFGVPIKRDGFVTLVDMVKFLKIIILDDAGCLLIKKTKRDIIFRVWFGQERFKISPVLQVYSPSFPAICDMKKNSILFPIDFMLYTRRSQPDSLENGLGYISTIPVGLFILGAHIVFIGRSNCVHEFSLSHVMLSRRLILQGVAIERGSNLLCEIRFISSSHKGLLHDLCQGSHASSELVAQEETIPARSPHG